MKITIDDIKSATIEPLELFDGLTLSVEFPFDEFTDFKPWDYESHLIREIYHPYGNVPKRAGEVVLHSHRWTHWLFDMKRAVRGFRHPTITRQQAAEAAERQADHWRRWLDDDWQYVDVVVTVKDALGAEFATECVGGFENNDDDYLYGEALSIAQPLVDRLLFEKANVEYWNSRDVETK